MVETSAGKVAGARTTHGWVFRGIPFAAPPVGELRYRQPQTVAPWSGVRDCSKFGPICLQDAQANPLRVSRKHPGTVFSEDCLYLNVWTPAVDDKRRPTMVWIHGGGFVLGGGSLPQYDGEAFARDDVVIVTLNYRLHAFGFLFLDESFEEAAGTGNLGILDQIAALLWVRDNIAAFGGDPDNVTVFGQSAGAMSVGALLATPAAAGLFRRAICQSGAAQHSLSRAAASRVAQRVLELLDVKPADWDALSGVAGDRIVKAANQVSREAPILLNGESPAGAFLPVIDHTTLAAKPIDLIADGAARDVDLLVGTCADEWRLFIFGQGQEARSRFEAAGNQLFASLGPKGADLRKAYAESSPGASVLDLFAAAKGDQLFTIPALRLAEAQLQHRSNIYMYRFSWRTPVKDGSLGACHIVDVPFVFETLDRMPDLVGETAPVGLASAIHRAWVRFAKSGNPNGDDLPDWPAYDTVRRPVLEFDETIRLLNDPRRELRLLLNGALQ